MTKLNDPADNQLGGKADPCHVLPNYCFLLCEPRLQLGAFRDTVPGKAGACLGCRSLGLLSLREKQPGDGEPALRINRTPELPAAASALWYQRSDFSVTRATTS